MLIAPHPDDEALACSVILQKAVRVGAAIRVVYATAGENNPWPQRVLERKWRISALDREHWGKLRRDEALSALGVLNVDLADVQFLGLPDQGLTDLLTRDCRSCLQCFQKVIVDWAPTHILVPSTADIHPDHSALAVTLRLVLNELPWPGREMAVWSYVVHGRSAAFFNRATAIDQSPSEVATKLAAIGCHKTQLKLSRKRFFAYAQCPEHFLRLTDRESTTADGYMSTLSRRADMLELKLRLHFKPLAPFAPRLFILGRKLAGDVGCSTLRIPLRAAGATTLTLPTAMFSAKHALFVKLDRRRIFFDEAGWLEVPPVADLCRTAAPIGEVEEPLLAIR